MKFSLITLGCITASAIASPVTSPLERRQRQVFEDPTCALSRAVTPNTPLSPLLPVASAIGILVAPAVKASIGARNRERIDSLGGTLCINSQEEPEGERGICQEFLQAVRDLADKRTPTEQAKQYKCILNLLCVARATNPPQGACQDLLRGADCVANRIIGTNDLECLGD